MDCGVGKERDFLVFDIDGTRQAGRQRALLSTPDLPPVQRRLDEVCAPGYTGRKRGEVIRTCTSILQAHTYQWVGTPLFRKTWYRFEILFVSFYLFKLIFIMMSFVFYIKVLICLV